MKKKNTLPVSQQKPYDWQKTSLSYTRLVIDSSVRLDKFEEQATISRITIQVQGSYTNFLPICLSVRTCLGFFLDYILLLDRDATLGPNKAFSQMLFFPLVVSLTSGVGWSCSTQNRQQQAQTAQKFYSQEKLKIPVPEALSCSMRKQLQSSRGQRRNRRQKL